MLINLLALLPGWDIFSPSTIQALGVLVNLGNLLESCEDTVDTNREDSGRFLTKETLYGSLVSCF